MSESDLADKRDGFIELQPGDWNPASDPRVSAATGVFLVVRGIVFVDVIFNDRHATELLGPGDLFPVAGDAVLNEQMSLSVLSATRVYLFDKHLEELIAERPAFGAKLLTASVEMGRRRVLHRTVVQLPRVEDRVLAMLWLLADQWGGVSSAGVFLELEGLTHSLLGCLIGARRPTVTMAISLLEGRGALQRDGARYTLLEGTWPRR